MKTLLDNPTIRPATSGRETHGFWVCGVTWLLLGFIFAFSVVRAKSQAIAHDEALTYVSYAGAGIQQMLKFSPNNHVLFTLVAALCTKLFGVSEFVLRAPTLLGMCAYLISSYFLCRRLFGVSMFLLFTSALLASNPVILDFMVAARGYGLGLALLMCAMAIFAALSSADPSSRSSWRWKCALGAICLGLAVAANLAFVIPAVCLSVSFAAVAIQSASAADESWVRKLAFVGGWLFVPGCIAAGFFLWPYLIQARAESFQFGYEKLAIFLRELVDSSFLYKWTDDTYANLGTNPLVPGSWQRIVSDLGVVVGIPLLILLIVGGLAFGLRRRGFSDKSNDRRSCQLFCGATIGCIILLGALHFALHNQYPVVRGCLYLIPLVTVSVALVARQLVAGLPPIGKTLCLMIPLLVAVDYLAALQMSTFRYNVYDARSREAFLSILGDVQAKGSGEQVRVGGTWWYEPEINFYRILYKASQIGGYDVKDSSASFVEQNALQPGQYDYFCFVQDNKPNFGNRRLRTIFHDPKTGITIVGIDK